MKPLFGFEEKCHIQACAILPGKRDSRCDRGSGERVLEILRRFLSQETRKAEAFTC